MEFGYDKCFQNVKNKVCLHSFSQLIYDNFQDTTDKLVDSEHSAADMFEYLPRNSTGLDTNGTSLKRATTYISFG